MLTPTPIATARFEDDDGEGGAAVESVEITGAPTAVPLGEAEVGVNKEEMETEPRIEVGVCEMDGKLEDVGCRMEEVITTDEVVVVDELVVEAQHCTSFGPGQYPLATPSSVKTHMQVTQS